MWPAGIHMHGYSDGFFRAYSNGKEILFSPDFLAKMINIRYPDVKGVRLFACWGVEAGAQRVANMIRRPVLTSIDAPISVFSDGKMYIKGEYRNGERVGDLILLLPH